MPDACRHNEACHRVDGLALTRGRGNQYQGGKQGQVFQAIQVGSLGANQDGRVINRVAPLPVIGGFIAGMLLVKPVVRLKI